MIAKVHPDDITKRMFVSALNAARIKCGGSISALQKILGLKSRNVTWFQGHVPPYETMQKIYPKLIEIAEGKNV